MSKHEAEAWSQIYREGKNFKTVPSEAVTRFLASIRRKAASSSALDIGCGTGQLVRELTGFGFDTTGIDFSDTAIDIARSVSNSGNRYLKFDIEIDNVATLPGQPYALITCKLVFAFIENKVAFIATVRRLLREYGLFVIITPVIGESAGSPNIAVDRVQTLQVLSEHFDVEVYDHDDLAYFVSKPRMTHES